MEIENHGCYLFSKRMFVHASKVKIYCFIGTHSWTEKPAPALSFLRRHDSLHPE